MIAILQPFIPHYRTAFFKGLKKKLDIDLYCYETTAKVKNNSFNIGNVEENAISNIAIGSFLLYNPFVLLSKKYNQLVLMWHFAHITTWFLLLTKPIHKKKIILWGQGISVKRYIKEEQSPNIFLKWMLAMADVLWFYTEKEKHQWEIMYPNKKMIALDNTISRIEEVVNYNANKSIEQLKKEYQITQEVCFIFCARFNNNYRRQDLLLKTIEELDSEKFGFIIIGDGPAKPSFSKHNNVYDYGAVYDEQKKQDLFTIADLYIQPGWVGLSIVEAMGYGKPIVTFKRSKEVLQCVEYYYLTHGKNALIFETVEDLILNINSLQPDEIENLQQNSRSFVKENLMMNKMVYKAISTLSEDKK